MKVAEVEPQLGPSWVEKEEHGPERGIEVVVVAEQLSGLELKLAVAEQHVLFLASGIVSG